MSDFMDKNHSARLEGGNICEIGAVSPQDHVTVNVASLAGLEVEVRCTWADTVAEVKARLSEQGVAPPPGQQTLVLSRCEVLEDEVQLLFYHSGAPAEDHSKFSLDVTLVITSFRLPIFSSPSQHKGLFSVSEDGLVVRKSSRAYWVQNLVSQPLGARSAAFAIRLEHVPDGDIDIGVSDGRINDGWLRRATRTRTTFAVSMSERFKLDSCEEGDEGGSYIDPLQVYGAPFLEPGGLVCGDTVVLRLLPTPMRDSDRVSEISFELQRDTEVVPLGVVSVHKEIRANQLHAAVAMRTIGTKFRVVPVTS